MTILSNFVGPVQAQTVEWIIMDRAQFKHKIKACSALDNSTPCSPVNTFSIKHMIALTCCYYKKKSGFLRNWSYTTVFVDTAHQLTIVWPNYCLLPLTFLTCGYYYLYYLVLLSWAIQTLPWFSLLFLSLCLCPLLLLLAPLRLFQELVWIRFLQINGDLGPHRLRYRCQY